MGKRQYIRKREHSIIREGWATSAPLESCKAMDARIAANIEAELGIKRSIKTIRNERSVLRLKFSERPKVQKDTGVVVPVSQRSYGNSSNIVVGATAGAGGGVSGAAGVPTFPTILKVEVPEMSDWKSDFSALLELVFTLPDEGLTELSDLVTHEQKRRKYLGR